MKLAITIQMLLNRLLRKFGEGPTELNRFVRQAVSDETEALMQNKNLSTDAILASHLRRLDEVRYG